LDVYRDDTLPGFGVRIAKAAAYEAAEAAKRILAERTLGKPQIRAQREAAATAGWFGITAHPVSSSGPPSSGAV
jgi:hypothetical protein